MAYSARLLAPVAAPPPPKPPQLNIVASALMPDVATDTLAPGSGPSLVAGAGWDSSVCDVTGRRQWHRLPGDLAGLRERAELRNALVAAIATMSDVELKQAEQDAGVTLDSLPESVFTATADSRWVGGFAYTPENQYRGMLYDTCSQIGDLPYVHSNGQAAPTAPGQTPSNTGGSLTAAASPYSYLIAAVFADGSVGLPTAPIASTIASGTSGSVALTWTDVVGAVGAAVFGRFAGSYRLLGTVAAGAQAFTDVGAGSPTLSGSVPLGNLPLVGYVPFSIEVVDETSAFGWSERDYVGRVLRLLDNATPNAIERELWSGAFAQAGPVYQSDFPTGLNAFFTQTGTPSAGGSTLVPVDLTPATPPSITRGTQILEDYLGNSGFGGQGMIHVAPETSPNLLGARRIGAILLSVMDNIIVPGTGFPTSGAQGPIGNANVNASATTAWMFATDLISVRLDAPFVYPATLAEALDRGTGGEPNRIRFRGQRAAAATWDGARLAACRVTLAT